MSFQAMAEVVKLRLPTNEKFVLLMLANYADQDGRCWPSIARLAADTGLCESSVKNALRSLRDYRGLIGIVPGGGATSNRYLLGMDAIRQLVASTGSTDTPAPHNPVTTCPPPGHHMPGRGAPHAPEPINEPITEPVNGERAPKKPALQEATAEHRALAASLGVDCAGEWEKYRDWLAATGKRHKDWEAGFRNWLKKARQFAPKADKHDAMSIAIWGDRAPAL